MLIIVIVGVVLLVLVGVSLAAWSAVAQPGQDRANALVALSVRLLPPERHDWGKAMLAELDSLEGCSDRWRFALGCARTALVPPRSSKRLSVALAAVVPVGGACVGLGISAVSPVLRVFAALFATLLTGCVWIALARYQLATHREGTPGLTFRAVVLVGVSACVGLTMYGVVRYPQAYDDPTHLFSVILAVMLGVHLWLALAPRRPDTNQATLARWCGLTGGVIIGGLWAAHGIAELRFGQSDLSGYPLMGYAMAASLVIPAIAGAVAAWVSGRMLTGIGAGVWAGLTGGLLLFVFGMSSTLAMANGFVPVDAVTISSFQASGLPDVATYEVSDNLGGLIMMLWMLPAFSVVGAVFGSTPAALGDPGLRARTSDPPHSDQPGGQVHDVAEGTVERVVVVDDDTAIVN